MIVGKIENRYQAQNMPM